MTAAPLAACGRCGHWFVREHGNMKYCPACVTTPRAEKRAAPRTCPCTFCGVPFRPRSLTQRYCSRACSGRSRRQEYSPRNRRVIAAYQEGQSLRAIGRQEGLSPEGVRLVLRQHEVSRRTISESRPFLLPDPDQEVRLRRLYIEEQRSCLFTAREMGVSCSTISNWLKNLGIGRRSAKEQLRLDWDRGLRQPPNRGRPISQTQRQRQIGAALQMWRRRKEQDEWRWGEPRPCAECGKAFRSLSPRNRFCSEECRKVGSALRLAGEKPGQKRRCANSDCVREYRPRSARQQYCSHPCYMKFRNRGGETTSGG